MSETLEIALAQINLHVGAIDANLAAIRRARAAAATLGADIVVTPEFSIGGYPTDDQVRKPAFVAACGDAIAAPAADTADVGPGVLRGGPWQDADRLDGGAMAGFDAALVPLSDHQRPHRPNPMSPI